jgi:peptidoglycan/xylan/chitin deacetylase (PgdA/CDA1 family)
VDRSAVPALVNDRKLTLKVDVGTAASVDVVVDGTVSASTYNAGTGIVLLSTAGTDISISTHGWTSGGTGLATKAMLYGDHHWAHSLTFDDGIQSQWDNAKPLLDARGLRAGLALNAYGIQGGNPWNMTWAETQALRAEGWDIFNHSYDHPTITCANFVTEFQQNQTLFLSKFPGYNVSHVVYPYENTGAAGCPGWPPSYILSGEGGGGLNYVDVSFPTANDYRLYRNGIFGGSETAWKSSADSARNNARPTWLITITHSVSAPGLTTTPDIYSTNADTLGRYLDYVNSSYGPSGDQSMWFAPSGEVYDYLLTRDKAVVSTLSCPTPTVTVTPAATALPLATDGSLLILKAVPFPQPNPSSLRLQLAGSAESTELSLFSAALSCVGRYEGPGIAGAGWVSVPLDSLSPPNGSYFFQARARRGSVLSPPFSGRLQIVR